MAQYNGYVDVPHGSYQEWRDATLGNGYDVDYSFGDQCWDFCALLWYQYGLRLITKTGGGLACDCWLVSKDANAQPPFKAISGKQNIKRGDVLVWNISGLHPGSHIAFADEDYNGTDRLNCLGQNQQGNGSGWPATIVGQPLNDFLGLFRNTNWEGGEPEPEPSETGIIKKSKFPWGVALNTWYKR